MLMDWVMSYPEWVFLYVAVISLIAAVITVVDKHKARRHKWRISEATLFFVAILGGAAAMLATMQIIRHKTRHRRFVWGLPLILTAQIGGVIWLMMG